MRMWEPGDPIEGGNDTGIPDVKYFDYLRDKSDDDDYLPSGKDYYPPMQPNFTFDECIENGKRLQNSGNYTDAITFYDLALTKVYCDEVALSGKAECLLKLGRNDEAFQCYYDLAYYNKFKNNDKTAVEYYKKCLELEPDNERVLMELGYVLENLKRYSDALIYFRRVEGGHADWDMAYCYMEMKKYSFAIPLLDNVINQSPHRDDWWDQKCKCLIKLNRKSEAIACHKQLIDFLIDEECYERALERIDILSKIKNDSFIEDRRSKCIKNGEILNKRLTVVLNAIASYHMYNPNGLDEMI
jgi:tetratricopeptide (TPR) repeat protein